MQQSGSFLSIIELLPSWFWHRWTCHCYGVLLRVLLFVPFFGDVLLFIASFDLFFRVKTSSLFVMFLVVGFGEGFGIPWGGGMFSHLWLLLISVQSC